MLWSKPVILKLNYFFSLLLLWLWVNKKAIFSRDSILKCKSNLIGLIWFADCSLTEKPKTGFMASQIWGQFLTNSTTWYFYFACTLQQSKEELWFKNCMTVLCAKPCWQFFLYLSLLIARPLGWVITTWSFSVCFYKWSK